MTLTGWNTDNLFMSVKQSHADGDKDVFQQVPRMNYTEDYATMQKA